jgi:hypothetical protein
MFSQIHLPIAAIVCLMQVGVGNEPSVLADPPYLAQWRECMAESGPLYEAGRWDEATKILERALEYARHFAPLDPRLARTIHAVGFLYQQQGKYLLPRASIGEPFICGSKWALSSTTPCG